MIAATIPVPTARGALVRPAVAVAAIGSAMAGIVHVDAALNHEGELLLTWMFALCAIAQLGWGAFVLARPRVSVLCAGLVINGGAVVFWATARLVGISFITSLADPEAVGRPDLGGALFAGAGVLGALRMLVRPTAPGRLTTRWLGAMAAVALVAGMPALTAKHTHEHTDGHEGTHLELAAGGDVHDTAGASHDETGASDAHSSAHEADHSATGTDVAVHDVHTATADAGAQHHTGAHTDATDPHDGHTTDPTDPADPTDPHDGHTTDPTDPTEPADPIVSLDDPRVTQAQFDAAIALVIGTTTSMIGFLAEDEVLARGYVPIGDGGEPGTYAHYVNWSYLVDDHELDPAHIEAIVMKVNADGTRRVVSAMYSLTFGKTMADVPDIAGELTTWHDHDNLCFAGGQIAGLAVDGVCATGVLVNTPPMLHVWVEDNGCGPFVGIDDNGITCEPTHAH